MSNLNLNIQNSPSFTSTYKYTTSCDPRRHYDDTLPELDIMSHKNPGK
ncbi:TPA: hypothetical protein IAA92_04375 [Candidatus Galligastranaerophilus intestinigallinarum]|nr:hypothetical protein [Candidatus Galligastranaerophilus intestinigallinarum]